MTNNPKHKYCYKHGRFETLYNKSECIYSLDSIQLYCSVCGSDKTEEYKQDILPHIRFRACRSCGYFAIDMIGKWRRDDEL